MLVKIIRNPANPTTAIQRVFPRPPVIVPNRTLQQQHGNLRQLPPPLAPVNETMKGLTSEDFYYPADWGKLKFANWIEGVKGKFKAGDVVTLVAIRPQGAIIPFMFTIEEISEIQKFTPWDRHAYEPAAVMVKTKGGVLYRKPPSVLRHLTEEETNLVVLQNTQPQGTA